ncbi:MAG: hypothetical protein C0616_01340 [Desulfuromonas sp.]|nr:MAG: hypothetical protein C0616_01340 [Desulfuromonas sp.]
MGKNKSRGHKQHQQSQNGSGPELKTERLAQLKMADSSKTLLVSWLLFLGCAFLLYGHALDSPLYLDDERVLFKLKSSLDPTLAWGHLWGGRGVSFLTFALNFSWFGPDVVGYRIFNVIIHALTAGLVFLIARRIFRQERLLPTFVGLLFLVHPLQTQSVTYITQRMTSLAGFWFFLACYLYILWKERSVQAGSFSNPAATVFYALALAAGALAVLSKENTAVLPVALLLLDRFFLPEIPGRRRTLPDQVCAVLPFAMAPLWLYFSRFSNWNAPAQGAKRVALQQGGHVTPIQYFATEASVVWHYVKQLFIPFPQQLFYDTPIAQGLGNAKTMVSLAGHALLLGIAFLWRKRFPLFLFGVGWFYLGLLVESSFIPLDPVFEHRLYLSMFGFAVLVPAMLGKLHRPQLQIVAIVLICVVLGVMTWRRNVVWNNDLAFYADNYRHAPDHPGLALTYGKRLNEAGRLEEAQVVLEGLVRSKPDYPSGYINLAYNYVAQKKYEETVNLVSMAAERDIFSAKLFYQLGNAHRGLKHSEYAVNSYMEAIDISPNFLPALVQLGNTHLSMHSLTDAESSFRKALELDPENGTAYLGLGMIAVRLRDIAAATENARHAVQYLPESSEAWFLLGATAKQRGDVNELRHAKAALERLDKNAAQRLERLERSR